MTKRVSKTLGLLKASWRVNFCISLDRLRCLVAGFSGCVLGDHIVTLDLPVAFLKRKHCKERVREKYLRAFLLSSELGQYLISCTETSKNNTILKNVTRRQQEISIVMLQKISIPERGSMIASMPIKVGVKRESKPGLSSWPASRQEDKRSKNLSILPNIWRRWIGAMGKK